MVEHTRFILEHTHKKRLTHTLLAPNQTNSSIHANHDQLNERLKKLKYFHRGYNFLIFIDELSTGVSNVGKF